MYLFEKSVPAVRINLDNGIYVFDCESATGKSYLAERLHALRSVGERVDSFSYPDVKKFGGPAAALNGVDFPMSDLRVVLFDRYGQYAGEFTDLINPLRHACIVLVDCKACTGLDVTGRCSIALSESEIVVDAGALCIRG